MKRLRDAAVLLTAFVLFFAVRRGLVAPDGVVRGFDSDMAILGLMGKKMFEGRGFDIFFWGQNHLGPLTSMIAAAWGFILGSVDPVALRLATWTQLLIAIVLTWWAVRRIDARAAALTACALAISPPSLYRMTGAESAVMLSAAILALVVAHVTRPGAVGFSPPAVLAFGILAGFSWWMNQQVVFTLIAAAVVLFLRTDWYAAIRPRLLLRDRLLLRGDRLGWRPIPGWLAALIFVVQLAGVLLLLALLFGFVAPFRVFGYAADALLLIVGPQLLLPLVLGEFRGTRSLTTGQRRELRTLLCFAAGFAAGYAPVWLGRILGWYERFYTFHFSPNSPEQVLAQLSRFFSTAGPDWAGIHRGALGALAALALLVFVAASGVRRSDARLLLAILVATNVLFYLLVRASPHYLVTSAGPLFALASLGALRLWDARRAAVRALVAVGGVIVLASLALSAEATRRHILAEPDPRPLLARVRAADCAVVYSGFWTTYRYRFLDGEQRAWIVYRGQNRNRAESERMQRLPGQRCLIENDGTLHRIDRDLPLVHAIPRP